jgi:hypothetical protein
MIHIRSILGVEPTRSELVGIFEKMGWGRATREQKRVRSVLADRIESLEGTILPVLQTPEGIRALTIAYLQARDGTREKPKFVKPQSREEPRPELGIAFYLN